MNELFKGLRNASLLRSHPGAFGRESEGPICANRALLSAPYSLTCWRSPLAHRPVTSGGLLAFARSDFARNHCRVETEVTPVCCACQELNAIYCVYIVLSSPLLVRSENKRLSSRDGGNGRKFGFAAALESCANRDHKIKIQASIYWKTVGKICRSMYCAQSAR